MEMIVRIIGLVIGLFTHGNNGAEKVASGFNGIALLGGVVGVAAWLFGPGKEWMVTLNALEIGFVLLAGHVAGEILKRSHPPGS